MKKIYAWMIKKFWNWEWINRILAALILNSIQVYFIHIHYSYKTVKMIESLFLYRNFQET